MRIYHFTFEPTEKDPRNQATAESQTLNSAWIALNKQGFTDRVIANAWHSGANTSSGAISLKELVGRAVPKYEKQGRRVELTQEFSFTKEVDEQCNKQKGSSHE